MGLFVICKVAGLYGQRVTVEDPDELSGQGTRVKPYVVHASHLAPYDEPYVEP